MNRRPTQFGVRESTASSRQHDSRLTAHSLPLIPDVAPRDLRDRQTTRVLASRASKTDNPIVTMSLEAVTRGQRGDGAESISATEAVITANELRRAPMAPEPFVSAEEAARFLCVKRRYLLELARRGITGAYALGTGSKRKIWVFRLSELAASVVRNETSIPKPPKPCTIGSGIPR